MSEKILTVLKDVGLEGWLEEWDVRHIFEEVSKLVPGQVYFEVGVAKGASMSVATLAAQPGVIVAGVDRINWDSREANITKVAAAFNRTPNVQFFDNESQLLGKTPPFSRIDLLFIDGDHTYEGTLRDIASWVPWVTSKGIIMFDDYNEKTDVARAVNETIYHHHAYSDFIIDGEMFLCRKL